MQKPDLQNKLDVEKWLQSETKQRDLCGEYEYCAYCNNDREYPCATAYLTMLEKKEQQEQLAMAAKLEKAETKIIVEEPADKEEAAAEEPTQKRVRKRAPSFEERLIGLPENVKYAYDVINSELKSYDGISNRIILTGHTYRIKRKLVAKIVIRGKATMRLNLALDPDRPEYGKYPHIDNRPKKCYEGVPMSIKLGSSLSIKRAKKLIAEAVAQVVKELAE